MLGRQTFYLYFYGSMLFNVVMVCYLFSPDIKNSVNVTNSFLMVLNNKLNSSSEFPLKTEMAVSESWFFFITQSNKQ